MPPEIKFDLPEAFHAKIAAGEYYKNIYIVYKTELDYPEPSTLVLVKKSGGFSMTGCGFQACADPNLSTTSIIIKTEVEDELEPLSIQIDKKNKAFSYHWGEKYANELPLIKKEYPLKPGKEFPSIQIENNFRNIDLGNSMNKIRVINWWATTCVPCIEEMPGLNTLVEKYQNKDIEFISIIWDHKNLDKFLNQNEYLYEHFATNSNVTNVLGETFPRNIVVDQNNIIRYNQTGGSKAKYKELDLLIQDIYKTAYNKN
jgi:thiol-disulfide isomerase/thioredoxin